MQNTLVDEVQSLIDRLAGRLRQSVAIDSRSGDLIAVSRHFGDADPYRMHLLLHRTMPQGAREYFASYVRDIRGSDPIRVPGNSQLAIEARWCYPVGDGLAYLWIIDRGTPLPGPEIAQYCRQLAAIFGERSTAQVELGIDADVAAWAREQVLGTSPSAPPIPEAVSRRYLVIASTGEDPDAGGGVDADVDNATSRQLALALRPAVLCGFSTLSVFESDGFVIAVLAGDHDGAVLETGALAWLRDESARNLREGETGVGTGMSCGGTAAELRQLFARAAIAAVLCRELYRSETILPWDEVAAIAAAGIAAGAAQRTGAGNGRTGAIAALLRDPESYAFDTVGAFVKSDSETGPAAVLHVHRTTVNYRVKQLAESTGLDLMIPSDRFIVFAEWLRVALERTVPASLRAAAQGNVIAEHAPAVSGDTYAQHHE